MHRTRIVLADDHDEFRDLAKRMLESEFDVVEAVIDGQALIDATARHDPDLLVVDVSMPRLNGLEAARRLKTTGARAKVVFLTVHQDQAFVDAAIQAGAQGYVTKHRLATDLAPALREVLAGRTFLSAVSHPHG